MPELPDVEGYRRIWNRFASGKIVRDSHVDSDILRNASPRAFVTALRDRCFEEPRRHGKWLICPTDGPSVLLHFGMTGDLSWSVEEPERHRHDRAWFILDDGEIRYRNMRKLGGVWFAHDEREVTAVLGPLGPDAWKLSRQDFVGRLSGRRGSIKSALMNQKVLAGLGNLTVDESLWFARINPTRAVASLTDAEMKKLHTQTQKVLRDSIPTGRVPGKASWITGARSSPDPICPRCKTKLSRTTVGGRTTYFCSKCQPG